MQYSSDVFSWLTFKKYYKSTSKQICVCLLLWLRRTIQKLLFVCLCVCVCVHVKKVNLISYRADAASSSPRTVLPHSPPIRRGRGRSGWSQACRSGAPVWRSLWGWGNDAELGERERENQSIIVSIRPERLWLLTNKQCSASPVCLPLVATLGRIQSDCQSSRFHLKIK